MVRCRLVACLVLGVFPLPGLPAWAEGVAAPMEIVGVSGGGSAQVRFVLEPGWKTYAPNPGPVGVEPVFTETGARNVASWHVVWPTPKALTSYGESFQGYDRSVDVEVVVLPLDSSQSTQLDLHVFAASCARLCVPLETEVVLVLPPDAVKG